MCLMTALAGLLPKPDHRHSCKDFQLLTKSSSSRFSIDVCPTCACEGCAILRTRTFLRVSEQKSPTTLPKPHPVSAMGIAVWPSCMRTNPIANVFEGRSEAELKSFAGNTMNVNVMCAVVAFALGGVALRPYLIE